MIDDIYDKFGESVVIQRIEDNRFKCAVEVQISKTFYGWVVGSCGKVHIVSPQKVIAEFNDFIQKIKTAY